MTSLADRRWSLVLLAVLAAALAGCGEAEVEPVQEPAAAGPLMQIDFTVEGMTCPNCVKTIERVMSRCAGVEEVTVDLEKGRAFAKGRGMDGAELSAAVAEAGYTATVLPAGSGTDPAIDPATDPSTDPGPDEQ